MNANNEILDFQNKFLELIKCPLSFETIKDPVMLYPTDYIYDKKSIELWLETNKTCPIENTKLIRYDLIPIKILSGIIKLFHDFIPDYIIMNYVKQESLLKTIDELENLNIIKEDKINKINKDFLKMADNESKYIYHKRKISLL